MYLSTGGYKPGNIRAIALNQSLPSWLLPSKELVESLCILAENILAALKQKRIYDGYHQTHTLRPSELYLQRLAKKLAILFCAAKQLRTHGNARQFSAPNLLWHQIEGFEHLRLFKVHGFESHSVRIIVVRSIWNCSFSANYFIVSPFIILYLLRMNHTYMVQLPCDLYNRSPLYPAEQLCRVRLLGSIDEGYSSNLLKPDQTLPARN